VNMRVQWAAAFVRLGMLCAGTAHASRGAERHAASPALHTATHARPLHGLKHRGTPVRRASRRHVATELRARSGALRPAAAAPVPNRAPARESHPRAALPLFLRSARHPTWSGGSRLAAALPRASGTLPVSAMIVAAHPDAHVANAGHEPNEARGPPRNGLIAPNPAAFARRISFLPRARLSASTTAAAYPRHSAWDLDDGAGPAARRSGVPLARARYPPDSGLDFTSVVPAQPHGRADARRMESATVRASWLSAGGVP
jgi:hypothetical protein